MNNSFNQKLSTVIPFMENLVMNKLKLKKVRQSHLLSIVHGIINPNEAL